MTSTAGRAIHAARAIRTLATNARSAFIDREEAISVIELALASGEHVIELGPPGTGKSALVLYFAKGLGLGFWRRLLNPDTTRDDLVGPIDPVALQKGVWERKWAGMAVNPLVFLDEVGKASGPVMNMTLDAMEERLVTGTVDRKIPLHSLFGATNETLSGESEAMWDRFTLRTVVRGFKESSPLIEMLARNRGRRSSVEDAEIAPPPVAIEEEDLEALRRMVRWMSENPSDAVLEAIAQLFNGLPKVSSEYVSPRRWERLLRVAAGRALLQGRTEIRPEDLVVGKYMLWQRIDDISKVQSFVETTVDPDGALIEASRAMVAELVRAASAALRSTDPTDKPAEMRARVNINADKILRSIREKTGRPEWAEIRSTVEAIKDQMLAAV